MLKQTLLLLSLFIMSICSGQNESIFFKTIPILDGSEPKWVSLMYAENPNVGEVEDEFRVYYKSHKFEKTIHTQNHKHWMLQVKGILDQDGFISRPSTEEENQKNQLLKEDYLLRSSAAGIPGAASGWVPMGPFETFKKNTALPVSWHKNVYAFDQSKSNPDILLCGTEAGGVYKSIDKGLNWTLISKGEVFAGSNSAVKIHPTDPNILLVASNYRIYQSTDGGTSWLERANTNGQGNEFEYAPGNSSHIYHTTTTGLYKSTDGGTTWNVIFTDRCYDIDFHPTDNTIAYLLKEKASDRRAEVWRSDDSGSTWNLKDVGYYLPSPTASAINEGGKIGLTPASPDLVYVALIGQAKTDDNGWIGIYKSTDKGENWSNPAGQDGGPYVDANDPGVWNVAAYSSGYHQGFFNFDFIVSPTDANKLWLATIRLSESTDGGTTFQSIGAAETTRLQNIHADVQDLHVQGDDVWVISDGGINYSNDELYSHVALNKGIQAAHFWGFNTGWNEDSYVGGKYHDGTTGWYEGYGLGNALNIGGVEEASGYIHPMNSRKMLYRTHYASDNTSVQTIPSVLGDQSLDHADYPVHPNESYSVGERSGIYFDPRYANRVYVGFENKVYKSNDGGGTFTPVFTFPDASGVVYEMEISRSNPDVIYGVYNPTGSYWDPCEIWKSIDAGSNWTKTATTPNGNLRFRLSISQTDENNVWVCTPRGANGQKVFATTDGGDTWINKTTTNLNEHNLVDILFQAGTNETVYVASDLGVKVWNGSDWDDYSVGLPLMAKSLQLNPFYRDGELRLASEGRGVWARKMQDTTFLPIAQPMTYADTIYCARDTTSFDCYSIIMHEGATWNWTFTPTPSYVSSNSVRNPKVVFGADGSYTVSLEITDALGNISTNTVQNMVTVQNECVADTLPGMALLCQTTSGYGTVPNLGLNNVDSLTISAWVKPNGDQNSWSGILFSDNDNSQAGLNFYTDNQLGYHWPGGAWWWESGLVVDTGEWSHVAMVATPNGITLYLNGVASEHVVALDPADITAMKIGSYHGWSSRNYQGEIDEVCMWDKAMSQDEIRTLRHLTRTGVNPFTENLVLYYQFNLAESSSLLDQVGPNHGSLSGAAVKTISTAPVGGGVSEILTINAAGNYTSSNSATTLAFGASNPNGEIVITRLNILPDSLPNSNPSPINYWIINNYGNSNFDLSTIHFTPASSLPTGLAANAQLYIRSENEFLNNWQTLCSADNLANDAYNFGASCNITSTHQFFIQSATNDIISIGTGVTNSLFGQDFSIVPNPTNSHITINTQVNHEELEIHVTDITGKLVQHQSFFNAQVIEMELLGKTGVYFVHIRANKTWANFKVIKN